MADPADHDQDERLAAALREAGLRRTDARLAVLRVVDAARAPLTHRDVNDALPELDRITVFRNLVALVEAGLALRVDLGDRVWRYAVPDAAHADAHVHPHFTCTACGDVVCLEEVKLLVDAGHAGLLAGAEVQIKGRCEACR